MSPLSALKLMVQHHPLGRDGIANLLGKTSETLRQELSGYPGFKMGVIDACVISEACISVQSEHCHAYANAVASNCGGFIELQVRDDMAEPIQSSVAGLVKEASDVLMAATTALADGAISDNDRKKVNRELTELLVQIQKVQRGVSAAHRTGKVRHEPAHS